MKRLFALLLSVVLIFLMCSCKSSKAPQQVSDTDYMHISEINHYAVEPDDKLHMTDEDEKHYKELMDTMLSHKPSVVLSDDNSKNEYYIDLLRQSPYFFFVDSCTLSDYTVHFTYDYSETQQSQMLEFMDSKFLEIVNTHATENDNTLDKILNVHGAVARSMTYDHDRKDNKQLGSPLFVYPDDEIYKALRDEKSLCYGFAYTLRFALLQLDIDCFCVYGKCTYRNEGHMWNIFRYEDKFYTCDSAWDRSDEGYAQLSHFGKTDRERAVDSLDKREFSGTYFDEYGEIVCDDFRFEMFRSISRYTYVNTHTYYMQDIKGKEYIFDSQTMMMK